MTVSLLSLGLMVVPIVAAQQAEEQGNQMPAGPGTVNYVEGAVYVDGQPLTRKQIGNAALDAGQELSTGAGKAEVLLTPGVFLRVDSNSVVKMISPQSTLMQVELEKGRAAVEVDEIHDENNLQIIDANIATRLQKTGYYEFDANHPEVMVFKGKADVQVPEGKGKEVKGNHEFLLADATTGQSLANQKPQELNDNRATDELFNWSKLRSQYLSESNNEMADEYADAYPGWYWDPYMWDYTYIGAGPFYSPFGWGFAPMGWGGWYGGGYGYGGYGYGGGYGGRYYGRGGPYRFGGSPARGGVYHGGSSHVGGFRGGMGGGGGFHGGGGGFHR